MATIINPNTGKRVRVDLARFNRMSTPELIAAYTELDANRGRDPLRQRARICRVVDLLDERAFSGDTEAITWFEQE